MSRAGIVQDTAIKGHETTSSCNNRSTRIYPATSFPPSLSDCLPLLLLVKDSIASIRISKLHSCDDILPRLLLLLLFLQLQTIFASDCVDIILLRSIHASCSSIDVQEENCLSFVRSFVGRSVAYGSVFRADPTSRRPPNYRRGWVVWLQWLVRLRCTDVLLLDRGQRAPKATSGLCPAGARSGRQGREGCTDGRRSVIGSD